MKYLPKLNLFYWVLIITANTIRETAGDLISKKLNLDYGRGTIALLTFFIIILSISIYSKSQNPLVFLVS